MKILLDTHVVFWALMMPAELSAPARSAISLASSIHVSAASAWEIATKTRLGKWPEANRFLERYADYVSDAGYAELPVTSRHALRAGLLASENQDPFDRLIAAQAEIEDLTVVTADRRFLDLPCRRLW